MPELGSIQRLELIRQRLRHSECLFNLARQFVCAVDQAAARSTRPFRRWFIAFEAGHSDHAKELDSTATKLGRFAGRAFAELKKRAKEP